MKKNILLLIMLISIKTYGQQKLYIHFNTDLGEIESFYVHNKAGIFMLSGTATLETVILGNYKSNEVLDVINDFKRKRIKKVFKIANIQVATYALREIDYPKNNYYLDDLVKDLPTSINGISFEYFANYYDDEAVKGKVKSIGGVKIKYFKDYYLSKKIKGKVSAIGNIKIKLLNDYVHPETTGKVSKIANVTIKYYFSYLRKELNGKVSAIGAYKIIYFDDIYDKRHFGEFKKMTGNDSRFELLQ